MNPSKPTPKSVDEYLYDFPEAVQYLLEELRQAIREAAPEAVETISYQMPAFMLHGKLVYFAGYKNHIGFYPTASGITAFKDELSTYNCTKGTVQFPLDKPLPLDLITRIVKFRVQENLAKALAKKGTRL
ncbi:iron chaperone [Fibrella arboris]|uniref:iron chaperone n=1 Tax=Fibrella arboris TaxID=3242486 RepID=UPI0035226701